MSEDKSRIILFCQGGAGDVLAHTPMIRHFRTRYPHDEIIVVATYAHLFDDNPHVDTVVPSKDIQDFYETEIRGKKVRFFKKHFVYDGIMDEPARNCKCLPEFICSMYNADYDKKPLDYVVSAQERRIANTFMSQYKNLGKPIVLLHCTGAIPSEGQPNKTNNLKDLNIEKMTALVKRNAEKATFVHMGLEGEPKVEGAIDALGMPMREAVALIPLCDTFIFIESIFAHCSNALGKQGIVVFQNMGKDFFGYSNNVNITFSGGCDMHPCNRPLGALLDLLPGYRNPKTREKVLWECPNQVCAQLPLEDLEQVLWEVLSKPKGNPELDKLRDQKPPQLKESEIKPVEISDVIPGATIIGDPVPIEKR